jgi:hypothetical protein
MTSMGKPPRPRRAPGDIPPAPLLPRLEPSEVPVDVESLAPPAPLPRAPALAELDERTRQLLGEAFARVVAEQLGHVRISSVPPESGDDDETKAEAKAEAEPPRSSMRVAAAGVGKVGKWGVIASGALSLTGTAIALLFRPEYAAPLAQALKLIAYVIAQAAGSGAPPVE